jgi:hypothetical protein
LRGAESVKGFSRALGNAVRCRELYEAATADIRVRDDPDVETLIRLGVHGETPKEKWECVLGKLSESLAIASSGGATRNCKEKWRYHNVIKVRDRP